MHTMRCAVIAGLAAAIAGPVLSGEVLAEQPGWSLRDGEGATLYALSTPSERTLNVKAVVLACEAIEGRKVLQIRLYPDGRGPLLPKGAKRGQLKEEARAQLEVDGTVHQVEFSFGGDYALVTDQVEADLPYLSRPLADKIEHGNRLVLRFDLIKDKPGGPEFDAEATVDLKAGDGGKAIAAVQRRCGY
jgi:hypothetical protein